MFKVSRWIPGRNQTEAWRVVTWPNIRLMLNCFRSLWKLDLCTTILPQIDKLLQSKYERWDWRFKRLNVWLLQLLSSTTHLQVIFLCFTFCLLKQWKMIPWSPTWCFQIAENQPLIMFEKQKSDSLVYLLEKVSAQQSVELIVIV